MIPAVDESPQIMAVRVTNRNKFRAEDKFDSRTYVFLPDVPVQVPVDAANHIFGWFPSWVDDNGTEHKPDPTVMRRHLQRRWGWNTPQLADKADWFYENIEIKPITYRMVPMDAEGEVKNELVEVKPEPKPVAVPKVRNKLYEAADEAQARHLPG